MSFGEQATFILYVAELLGESQKIVVELILSETKSSDASTSISRTETFILYTYQSKNAL